MYCQSRENLAIFEFLDQSVDY
uniref:Uncharacterized protein n=1 Tax=Arundo donax TaxID=35708 RepID=A0A0A9B418_ARUDO